MKQFFFILSGVLTCFSLRAQPADSLAQTFYSPPTETRPWGYWFWNNGNVTSNGITADLEAMQCRVENVFINTDIYSVQASRPTHGTSGLITPANNNAGLTILRNVVVTGYHTGITVNEHTDADNINLACVFNGLEFQFAHHASRFGRVGAQRCTHSISVTGKHGFTIEQLDIEIAGKGQTDSNNVWQATEYNINDPDNLAIADINYWVVEGNVGATGKFTCNGGAGILVRRIGSAPPESRQLVK